MPQIPTHSVANTPPSLDTVDVSSWKQELDDLRQAAQDKYLPKKVVKPVLEQENLDPLVLPNTGAPYDPNTSVLIPRFDEVELKA
jgi:hypothetical protein